MMRDLTCSVYLLLRSRSVLLNGLSWIGDNIHVNNSIPCDL